MYNPGMSERQKKAAWPWIIACIVGLPVLYVLSFGPAWWVAGYYENDVHAHQISHAIGRFYRPIRLVMDRSDFAFKAFCWYADLGPDFVRRRKAAQKRLDASSL